MGQRSQNMKMRYRTTEGVGTGACYPSRWQGWTRPPEGKGNTVLLCHFVLFKKVQQFRFLGLLGLKSYMAPFIFPLLFLPLPAFPSEPRMNFGVYGFLLHSGPGILSYLQALGNPTSRAIFFMRSVFAL